MPRLIEPANCPHIPSFTHLSTSRPPFTAPNVMVTTLDSEYEYEDDYEYEYTDEDEEVTDEGDQPTSLPASRRLAIMMLIAIVGVVAALPFRRPQPTEANEHANATQPTIESRFAPPTDTSNRPLVSDQSLPPRIPFAGQEDDTNTDPPSPQPIPPAQLKHQDSPPTIPATYEPLVVPRPIEQVDADEIEQAARSLPDQLKQLADKQRWPVTQRSTLPSGAPRPRPYRIRDGDTLPNLATRYLGDPNRAQDIWALNQQALPQPDALPIGETIWIPAQ